MAMSNGLSSAPRAAGLGLGEGRGQLSFEAETKWAKAEPKRAKAPQIGESHLETGKPQGQMSKTRQIAASILSGIGIGGAVGGLTWFACFAFSVAFPLGPVAIIAAAVAVVAMIVIGICLHKSESGHSQAPSARSAPTVDSANPTPEAESKRVAAEEKPKSRWSEFLNLWEEADRLQLEYSRNDAALKQILDPISNQAEFDRLTRLQEANKAAGIQLPKRFISAIQGASFSEEAFVTHFAKTLLPAKAVLDRAVATGSDKVKGFAGVMNLRFDGIGHTLFKLLKQMQKCAAVKVEGEGHKIAVDQEIFRLWVLFNRDADNMLKLLRKFEIYLDQRSTGTEMPGLKVEVQSLNKKILDDHRAIKSLLAGLRKAHPQLEEVCSMVAINLNLTCGQCITLRKLIDKKAVPSAEREAKAKAEHGPGLRPPLAAGDPRPMGVPAASSAAPAAPLAV